MAEIISNVLDFARGRLSDGLTLELSPQPLAPVLEQVVDEFRSARPDRRFAVAIRDAERVRCDAPRIGQLVSNLIGNAIAHGAEAGPIRIEAGRQSSHFEISVANEGAPIPRETIASLFKPFFRADGSSTAQGLGLGLYIASLIADGHGGELLVASDAAETRFTLRFPITDSGTMAATPREPVPADA